MVNILCIGELLIDFVSLENGKKLTDTKKFVKKAGGAPANTCRAINTLESQAFFVGTVGKDSFGKFLIQKLIENNISPKYVKKTNKSTTLSFVSLDERGERSFEFVRGADEDIKFNDIPKKLLKKCKIIHFGSATAFLGGDLEKNYTELLNYAKKNNKIISFDCNYRKAFFEEKKAQFIKKTKKFLSRADIIKLSSIEAKILTKEKNLDEAINKLTFNNNKHIFVTLGKNGTLYASSNFRKKVPSIIVKTIDSTGAGDAFIGALIGQIRNRDDLNSKQLLKYVKVANIVAALTTTKKGGLEAIPSKRVIQKYIG